MTTPRCPISALLRPTFADSGESILEYKKYEVNPEYAHLTGRSVTSSDSSPYVMTKAIPHRFPATPRTPTLPTIRPSHYSYRHTYNIAILLQGLVHPWNILVNAKPESHGVASDVQPCPLRPRHGSGRVIPQTWWVRDFRADLLFTLRKEADVSFGHNS